MNRQVLCASEVALSKELIDMNIESNCLFTQLLFIETGFCSFNAHMELSFAMLPAGFMFTLNRRDTQITISITGFQYREL